MPIKDSKPFGSIIVLNTVPIITENDLFGNNGKLEEAKEVKLDGTEKTIEKTEPVVKTEEKKVEEKTEGVQLSAEDKAIADKFGGVSFNEKGDLLNDKKEVVKSKADLDAAKAEEEKNKPKFDDKGNQVDDKGTIIKTKEAIEIETIENENRAYLDNMINVVGIKPLGEDGKPKVYEATEEGRNQYLADVVKESQKIGVQSLFKALPDVEEYTKYRMMGGDPSKYFKQEIDYSKVDVKALAEDQKFNVIVNFHVNNGIPEEQAKQIATYAKEGKQLDVQAKAAVDALAAKQTQDKTNEMNRLKTERDQQIQQIQEHWDGIGKQVKEQGKIGDMVIPVTEREEFFKYISVDVDGKGHSQAALDAMKRDKDMNLFLDYIYGFKKTDLKTVLQTLNGVAKVQTLTKMKSTENLTKENNEVIIEKTNHIPSSLDELVWDATKPVGK